MTLTNGRRPLIAGNWKMFHGGPTACDLAAAIAEGLADVSGAAAVDVVVAPPVTAIAAVAHEVDGSDVAVGAQNMHAKDSGAFTGEISAPMLVACGATWVILGHSERRQLFGETDEGVAQKTASAFRHGLTPIVCVGETLEEREADQTIGVITRQLAAVLPQLVGAPALGSAAVAYEPVWAIGTGRVATTAQAQEVHAAIRAQLAAASPDLALRTRILYGGSVKPDNAADLLACADVDGALVGGASLEAPSFLAIVRAAATLAHAEATLSPPPCRPHSPSCTSSRASSSSSSCSSSKVEAAVSARHSVAVAAANKSSAGAAQATCSPD
jgi:triosephosphate isomerase (TIM)